MCYPFVKEHASYFVGFDVWLADSVLYSGVTRSGVVTQTKVRGLQACFGRKSEIVSGVNILVLRVYAASSSKWLRTL